MKGIRLNSIPEKILYHPWLELALRWVLGITFLYASIHKIVDPGKFAEVIYGYDLFPDYTINLIAIVIPFFELCMALALILGIYPRTAALIMAIMLLAFMTALSINLIRDLAFDCGCFSFSDRPTRSAVILLLARDVIYFIFGLPVLLFPRYRKGCLLQSGSLLTNLRSP